MERLLDNRILDKLNTNMHVRHFADELCNAMYEYDVHYKNLILNLTLETGKVTVLSYVAEMCKRLMEGASYNTPGGLLVKIAKERLPDDVKRKLFHRKRKISAKPVSLASMVCIALARVGIIRIISWPFSVTLPEIDL